MREHYWIFRRLPFVHLNDSPLYKNNGNGYILDVVDAPKVKVR